MKTDTTRPKYLSAKINLVEFYEKSKDFINQLAISNSVKPDLINAKRCNLEVIYQYLVYSDMYIKLLENGNEMSKSKSDRIQNNEEIKKEISLEDFNLHDKSQREAARDFSKTRVLEIWPELF